MQHAFLQAANVASFRAIKTEWRKAVRNFHSKNPGVILTKANFAPVLKDVIDSNAKAETLINGFRACGLFPFTADAVDYSKCLGNPSRPVEQSTVEREVEANSVRVLNFDTFREIVGDDKIHKFQHISEVVAQSEEVGNEDFFILYRLWEKIKPSDGQEPQKQMQTNQCDPQNQLDQEAENFCIESQEGQVNNPCDEINSTRSRPITPIPGCSKDSITWPTDASAGKTAERSVVKKVSNDLMGVFLVWPETPKRKGKRDVERQPFAITSQKYKDMYEAKIDKKRRAEEEKEERKKKRTEAKKLKEEKKLNVVKKTSQKARKARSRLFTEEDITKQFTKKPPCAKCKEQTKGKNEGVTCDDCKMLYHKWCIPKGHQQHIPESNDDLFLCHNCFHEDNSESYGEDSDESHSPYYI